MSEYNPRVRIGRKWRDITPLPNFPDNKITVTLDDKTQSLLESINESLIKLTNADTQIAELDKKECDRDVQSVSSAMDN